MLLLFRVIFYRNIGQVLSTTGNNCSNIGTHMVLYLDIAIVAYLQHLIFIKSRLQFVLVCECNKTLDFNFKNKKNHFILTTKKSCLLAK